MQIVSIKAPWELLVNLLEHGRTIIERVQAARALKVYSSRIVVRALKERVLSDKFWFVRVEAAKTLGTIKEEYAYEALKDCLTKFQDPRVKKATIAAIGEFRRKESIDMLKPILDSDSESYGVQSAVATAIGMTREPSALPLLKSATLKETYMDLLAQGAIAGLKEFAGNKEVADLLLEKSKYGNRNKVREAATLALGKYAAGNQQIIDHLRNNLLRDRWFRVRKNTCKALADAEITDAIADLSWVADHDIDAGVRRIADECIFLLEQKLEISRQMIMAAGVEPKVGAIERLEAQLTKKRKMHIEFLSKMDSYESRDR